MEATLGGKAHQFYGPVMPDLKAVGKRSVEWDLNDWNWDGDLFRASPLNSVPSDCRSRRLFPVGSEIPNSTGLSNSWSSSSDEINGGNEKGKRELEKRRRDVVVVEDEELNNEAGYLNLKLGGQVYPITENEVEKWEEKSGKKSKVNAATTNRAVCQVDDCRADLTNAKDYHRRHKVCDLHSKSTRALVGNVMQRFCQQCSRFHVLQEFDEGKRSCRRRLAGHNRRRRKTHPENGVNAGSLNDERGSSYLLVSLLRILSNLQTSSSDQTKDQDMLSHLLRSLANLAGSTNGINTAGLLPDSQDLQAAGTSLETPGKVLDMILNPSKCSSSMLGSPSKVDNGIDIQDSLQPNGESVPLSAFKGIPKRSFADTTLSGPLQTPSAIPCPARESFPTMASAPENGSACTKFNGIDLNNVYDDSQDSGENLEYHVSVNLGLGSVGCALLRHQDFQKSNPPRTSGNSCSPSSLSPSSSSGEAQEVIINRDGTYMSSRLNSRTDRIVFKLFGKDPSNFPMVLRRQILDWLSHSPTDIESYIRPGCIILTIYLRLEKCSWEELCCDLSSNLTKLLDASIDSFWRTGWVYTRVQHRVAFLYNGQIVLDTLLPSKSHNNCRILSIKPVAVPFCERAQFSVKGFNLSRPTTRLFCALEGKYLLQGSCDNMVQGGDTLVDNDEIQCVSFSCSIPNVNGRGFIEVEDHGLSGSFLPFIVSEKNVCSEICTLESEIELPETAADVHMKPDITNARSTALDFIHEIGWLLHRSQLKLRLDSMDPNVDLFPFKRFKWLMEFSIEHDWCAVVKKLLGIVFDGTVDAGEHPSVELALVEMGLLHRAVRRHCKSMVEVLLRYELSSQQKQRVKMETNLLFRPDACGPGGLTPLHIAASSEGSESVLDALTDDPESLGIEAWKGVRDSTGLTPKDYASLRGYHSYVNLVQRKTNKQSGNGHLVLDIPSRALPEYNKTKKQNPTVGHTWAKLFSSFHTEKNEAKPVLRSCKLCQQKLAYRSVKTSAAIYRPAMLSVVAIAAVCVCVALLFKSSPEVSFCYRPFIWEALKYGSS